MKNSPWHRISVLAFFALLAQLGTGLARATPSVPSDPTALFKENCAICHERPETKAPSVAALRQLNAQRIWQTIEIGVMQPMAKGLSPEQRLQIANWLGAKEDNKRYEWLETRACRRETPATLTGEENWGMGRHNMRNPSGVELTPGNVAQLELKWSLALPAVSSMRSLPVVAGDTIYLGGQDGKLLALDRETGCVRWHLAVDGTIRNALTLERTPDGINTLFFADEPGTVYAVNAVTGALRWKAPVKSHPMSIVSGSIAYHNGRIFVPISLFEVMVAASPQHECCRAHGGVIALDARSGARIWHYGTTPEAEKTTLNSAGTQMWGPSGAAVWNRPTVDAKRGVIYFGTGENASSPATNTSDAIIALDMANGQPRWIFQALRDDAWNLGCNFKTANCPKENGPDFDFGAPPILVKDGKGKGKGDLLLAGQKSGEVFALDPDAGGAVVWRHHFLPNLSHFLGNGGIHHGMASDGERLIVPISDPVYPGYSPQPGVHAMSVADGRILWSHRIVRGCEFVADKPGAKPIADTLGTVTSASPWPECPRLYSPSAPPTLANGVAYVATLDGKVRLFDADSGRLLRVLETNRPFQTSNGVDGHGGAIDAGGVLVSRDQMIVSSGYGMFGQMPGNVLLVYGFGKSK